MEELGEICVDEELGESGLEEEGEGWSEDAGELLFVRGTLLSMVSTKIGDMLVGESCDDLVSLNLKVDWGKRLRDKLGLGDKLNSFASPDQR